MQRIFEWLGYKLPYFLIPKHQYSVNGARQNYSEKENRERWGKAGYSYFVGLYTDHPLRKKILLIRKKAIQRELNEVIGEIALIHAHCEQYLRLMVRHFNSNPPEKHRHGKPLRELARDTISDLLKTGRLSPVEKDFWPENLQPPSKEEAVEKFNNWVDEFSTISQQRNETLKTNYLIVDADLRLLKEDTDALYSRDGEYLSPVSFNELYKLRDELAKYRFELMRIHFTLQQLFLPAPIV